MAPVGQDAELAAGPPRDPAAPHEDSYEEFAQWLQNEAERLFTLGQYGGAEQKVRQLLDLQNQVVGQQHADFALGLSMLAELRFLQGDRVAAEGLFRRSLGIRGAVLGRSHPDYAVSLTCLAGMLWRRDALDDAERCLREALAIRYDALGPDHPESVQGRKELVRILRHRGDWAGAQALIRPFLARAAPSNGQPIGRDLSDDLVVLSSQFQRLGETLASAARLMSSVGAPPPRGCVLDLWDCRKRFDTLQGEAVERIESLRVPNPPAITLGTLQDLASILDDLADAERHQVEREQLRREALTVLDRVFALTFVRHEVFPPLRECQEQARQLRDTIESGHWLELPAQTESLVDGTHALANLLIFIEAGDSLSDHDWAELYEFLGESLGQPLALAAARARLVMADLPQRRAAYADRPRTVVPQPMARALPITPEPTPYPVPASSTPTPTPRTNSSSTVLCDVAMASLVPSMGTVINLPTATPSEPEAHRLLRVGRAPNVVERSLSAGSASAGRLNPGGPVNPDGTERRRAAGRRAVPSLIAGPLPLLNSFGPTLDPGKRNGLIITSPFGAGNQGE
ncbi:tetratricopeptide repeat protein [Singulisphaera sp. GP187]|uniref:tetratricopeptide repeat protein n=1 Tax=Singulisphaera sp. GP187 TaxID=1882752 RepID=UPI0009419296|nr:tetratricopeptide repeat protein [Singulisphaera sp. GP187]